MSNGKTQPTRAETLLGAYIGARTGCHSIDCRTSIIQVLSKMSTLQRQRITDSQGVEICEQKVFLFDVLQLVYNDPTAH